MYKSALVTIYIYIIYIHIYISILIDTCTMTMIQSYTCMTNTHITSKPRIYGVGMEAAAIYMNIYI